MIISKLEKNSMIKKLTLFWCHGGSRASRSLRWRFSGRWRTVRSAGHCELVLAEALVLGHDGAEQGLLLLLHLGPVGPGCALLILLAFGCAVLPFLHLLVFLDDLLSLGVHLLHWTRRWWLSRCPWGRARCWWGCCCGAGSGWCRRWVIYV